MAQNYGNWLGILKWTLAQGSDGTKDSDVKEMSLEDREWLTRAFESMCVDEAKRMEELYKMFPEDENVDDPEEVFDRKMGALDELESFIEGYDNAKNFYIIGGFLPLLKLIDETRSDEVRRRALEILSTLMHNNPKTQEWSLAAGTMDVLDRILVRYSPAFENNIPSLENMKREELAVRAAAITALSALVRDHRNAQEQAARWEDGRIIQHLLRPLREWKLYAPSTIENSVNSSKVKEGRRLVRKSLFFARHLLVSSIPDLLMSAICTGVSFSSHPARANPITKADLTSSDIADSTILKSLLLILTELSSLPPVEEEDSPFHQAISHVDLIDIRENAAAIVLALLKPNEFFSGVLDDSNDARKPRGLNEINSSNSAAKSSVSTSGNTITNTTTAPKTTTTTTTSTTASATSTASSDGKKGGLSLVTTLAIPSTIESSSITSSFGIPVLSVEDRKAALEALGFEEKLTLHVNNLIGIVKMLEDPNNLKFLDDDTRKTAKDILTEEVVAAKAIVSAF